MEAPPQIGLGYAGATGSPDQRTLLRRADGASTFRNRPTPGDPRSVSLDIAAGELPIEWLTASFEMRTVKTSRYVCAGEMRPDDDCESRGEGRRALHRRAGAPGERPRVHHRQRTLHRRHQPAQYPARRLRPLAARARAH